jgi:hypothetical protein
MIRPSVKRLFWIGLALVAFLILLTFLFHSGEPVARGKPFGHWFRIAWSSASPLERLRAFQAIREMGGAAAIPLAIQAEREDSSIQVFYWNNYKLVPAWMRARLPVPLPLGDRQQTAVTLLNTLGPSMQPAVPHLIYLYKRNYLKQYPQNSGKAFGWTEQFENPPVSMKRGSPVTDLRAGILYFICRYDTNAEIVPLMLSAVQENALVDKDATPVWLTFPTASLSNALLNYQSLVVEASTNQFKSVRILAQDMLELLPGHAADLAKSLLLNSGETDRDARLYVIYSMAGKSLDFDAALPVLAGFVSDDDPIVRDSAMHALLVSTGRGRDLSVALKDSLYNKDSAMRLAALQVLLQMPEQSRANADRIRELNKATVETNASIRSVAQEILDTFLAE